jgi:uncharacterized protein (TIGR00255 family)
MIKSMTGFGRGESSDGVHSFSVEIKTVNHRYNDIIVKMPKYLLFLEEKVKKHIKEYINRGRVEVYINLEYLADSNIEVNVNIPLALAYKRELENLINQLEIGDDISLTHLLTLPEVIKTERKDVDEDVVWGCLSQALEIALENVVNMRKKEGIELKKDIEIQLRKLENLIDKIEKRAPQVVMEYKEKLKERVSELMDEDADLDEERLNFEVVLFADKSDINEEVVRFKSHIKQFYMSLEQDEAVGRKLDFLIQEMNREVNTIGSKANDLEIINDVMDIKAQLEKIREQVQNIE